MLGSVAQSNDLAKVGSTIAVDGTSGTLFAWLRLDKVEWGHVVALAPGLAQVTKNIVDELMVDARYAPYVARQDQDVERLRADEALAIRSTIDYSALPSLSSEMIERLRNAGPSTIGEAARIRGITPAALAAVFVATQRTPR